jgi:plasmid stabilization system protein ParE
MKVIFVASSDEGVRWFTRYYRFTFPEGRGNARRQMAKTLAALSDNPRIGRPISDSKQREYSIPRTPFSIIYRIANDRIEILRVLDGRANRDDLSANEGSD